MPYTVGEVEHAQLHVHPATAQMECLMTTLCDRSAPASEFVFVSDRCCRLMIEFALNFLPTTPRTVTTCVDGEMYEGREFAGSIVGVSIIRAGEAMENALRSCCRNVRLGKILVQRDERTAEPHYYMAKLPTDICTRHVLLMDPMLATGGTACMAVRKLVEEGVQEGKIIFVSVVVAPEGVGRLLREFPGITVCTGRVAGGLNDKKYIRMGPGDYGDRYFGTTT